jgi:hypothetical protein
VVSARLALFFTFLLILVPGQVQIVLVVLVALAVTVFTVVTAALATLV